MEVHKVQYASIRDVLVRCQQDMTITTSPVCYSRICTSAFDQGSGVISMRYSLYEENAHTLYIFVGTFPPCYITFASGGVDINT